MKKELEKKNRREGSRSTKKQTFDASQVVGIVRAGLALELKRSLGPKFIMERETELVELTRARLEGLKEIIGEKEKCEKSLKINSMQTLPDQFSFDKSVDAVALDSVICDPPRLIQLVPASRLRRRPP